MNSVTFHGQDYEYYSWENLGKVVFELSDQIIKSELQFDCLVALAKGGLAFSRSVADYLAIPKVSSIQIEFYTGIGETQKTPVITQSLPISIRGSKVLIFDDVVDSGETIKLAKTYLQHHGAHSIHTATLVGKTWAAHKADFTAVESKSWVIFPNEARETIETLSKMWSSKGDSQSEVRQQLHEVGFTEAEVALFHPVE
ncbi:MAG: phosphoribosyltransferase [bacterium]|nr:phosphoribosyltransferase [bacterium]